MAMIVHRIKELIYGKTLLKFTDFKFIDRKVATLLFQKYSIAGNISP